MRIDPELTVEWKPARTVSDRFERVNPRTPRTCWLRMALASAWDSAYNANALRP